VNYKVWVNPKNDVFLQISPALRDEFSGDKMNELIYTNGIEALSIATKRDALRVLYDTYQGDSGLKEGDTFTFKGDKRPFAVARGVHIIPYK